MAESTAFTLSFPGPALASCSGFGVMVTGHGIVGHFPVARGAAKMYATTIVAWAPGASCSGPLDWKVRASDGWVFTKQRWVTAGLPVLHCGSFAPSWPEM